jgi:hypothetical protein
LDSEKSARALVASAQVAMRMGEPMSDFLSLAFLCPLLIGLMIGLMIGRIIGHMEGFKEGERWGMNTFTHRR